MEHSILQGEGGEQGDPLMPLLSSLGQHLEDEVGSHPLLRRCEGSRNMSPAQPVLRTSSVLVIILPLAHFQFLPTNTTLAAVRRCQVFFLTVSL